MPSRPDNLHAHHASRMPMPRAWYVTGSGIMS
jgi:hypothetical protein